MAVIKLSIPEFLDKPILLNILLSIHSMHFRDQIRFYFLKYPKVFVFLELSEESLGTQKTQKRVRISHNKQVIGVRVIGFTVVDRFAHPDICCPLSKSCSIAECIQKGKYPNETVRLKEKS